MKMLGKEARLRARSWQCNGKESTGRDVCEREKRHGQVWAGELGASPHHESAKERGPERRG